MTAIKTPMGGRLLTLFLILAFAALALVGADGAQQSGRVYRLGWLSPHAGSASPGGAFLQAMREHGYIERRNLHIEERYTKGHFDRYPALADELVASNPDCIVAIGIGATRAAEQATTRIPIVMGNADNDPVRLGLVASYAHPGGNVTGVTNIGADLSGKRLGFLRDLIPGLSHVAILWQPGNSASAAHVRQTESAAASTGVKIDRLPIRAAKDLDGAFRKASGSGAQAVIVPGVGLMNVYRPKITRLAVTARLPLMATNAPFAVAGALISYDADREDRLRQAAGYVSRILQGAEPADLPVVGPTKFELVINLKTAKALGITIPPSILYRANKVIE